MWLCLWLFSLFMYRINTLLMCLQLDAAAMWSGIFKVKGNYSLWLVPSEQRKHQRFLVWSVVSSCDKNEWGRIVTKQQCCLHFHKVAHILFNNSFFFNNSFPFPFSVWYFFQCHRSSGHINNVCFLFWAMKSTLLSENPFPSISEWL